MFLRRNDNDKGPDGREGRREAHWRIERRLERLRTGQGRRAGRGKVREVGESRLHRDLPMMAGGWSVRERMGRPWACLKQSGMTDQVCILKSSIRSWRSTSTVGDWRFVHWSREDSGASKCLPLLSARLCGTEGTALPVGGNREAESFHKEVFSTGRGFAKLEPALPGGRGPLTEGARAEAAGDGEAVRSGEASSWEEAVGWSAVFSWFPQSPGGCAEPLGRCCDEGQVGRAAPSPEPLHLWDLEPGGLSPNTS